MKEENSTNQIDRIAKEVVDAAFKVHSSLGPGLLESAYETCLAHELSNNLRQSTKPSFLMNFNVPMIKDGIRRIANHFQTH